MPEIYSDLLKRGESEIHKKIKEFIKFGEALRKNDSYFFHCYYRDYSTWPQDPSEDSKTLLRFSNMRTFVINTGFHNKKDIESILKSSVVLETGYNWQQ